MRVYVDTEVVKKLGATSAFLLEYIYTYTHHSIDTKFSVSALSRAVPASLRTCQRLMNSLVDRGYLLKTTSGYTLTDKFFITFESYNLNIDYE